MVSLESPSDEGDAVLRDVYVKLRERADGSGMRGTLA